MPAALVGGRRCMQTLSKGVMATRGSWCGWDEGKAKANGDWMGVWPSLWDIRVFGKLHRFRFAKFPSKLDTYSVH